LESVLHCYKYNYMWHMLWLYLQVKSHLGKQINIVLLYYILLKRAHDKYIVRCSPWQNARLFIYDSINMVHQYLFRQLCFTSTHSECDKAFSDGGSPACQTMLKKYKYSIISETSNNMYNNELKMNKDKISTISEEAIIYTNCIKLVN
jgi:hypothetical protein